MINRSLIALLVFAGVLIFSKDCRANGGPVAWTGATPIGAVGLVQDPDIALRSEDLKIRVTGFNTYTVKASYRLQNDGAAKKVLFGVPLTWPSENTDGSEPDPESAKAEKISAKKAFTIAKDISITLNGEPVPCTLSPGSAIPLTDAHLLPDYGDYVYKVTRWCVATLPFAEKAEANLVLEYSAQLFYEDLAFSKSALTEFGVRQLLYLFYPAGYWKGPAETVTITVDTGPYSSFKKGEGPADEHVDGRTITWSLHDVDFKNVPRLALSFDPNVLAKNELLTWNKNAGPNEKIPLKVKASSTLHDMGDANYKAENVLDGKGETAWCEGVPGSGEGQWLQFEVKGKKAGEYCRLQGIAITPGYARNQKAYRENGRVRKIRITDCQGKRPYALAVKVAGSYDMAPVLLDMPGEVKKTGFLNMSTEYIEPLDYVEKEKCFRMTIIEVEKGSSDDTCISEVALVLNCG